MMRLLTTARRGLTWATTWAVILSPTIANAQGNPAVNPPRDPQRIQSETRFDRLDEPVSAIFTLLITLIPTIAAIYLAISGYRYMTAQGNPELVERAKKSLLYAVYGFVVALISVALVYMIARAFGFRAGLSL